MTADAAPRGGSVVSADQLHPHRQLTPRESLANLPEELHHVRVIEGPVRTLSQ